jgi:hypothetical protein
MVLRLHHLVFRRHDNNLFPISPHVWNQGNTPESSIPSYFICVGYLLSSSIICVSHHARRIQESVGWTAHFDSCTRICLDLDPLNRPYFSEYLTTKQGSRTEYFRSTPNIVILERFQSKALRMITNAPWYAPNTVIRKDLQIPTVKQEISRYSYNYSKRLSVHPN